MPKYHYTAICKPPAATSGHKAALITAKVKIIQIGNFSVTFSKDLQLLGLTYLKEVNQSQYQLEWFYSF